MIKKVLITKSFYFEAAHNLPGHEGKCQDLHGHSYKLDITVKRAKERVVLGGPSDGMVTDFSSLKELVNVTVVDKLDHKNLNEVFTFRPTAENMAMWIGSKLSEVLEPVDLVITSVRLWETRDAFAEVIFE